MSKSAHFTRLFLVAIALVSASAAWAQQQPDETLPGFKTGNVYDSNGIDNVNVFSGDPGIAIPLGPTYPLGPGNSWQLKAYYSGKYWFLGRPCGVGTGQNAFVLGRSTLGVGWTLGLGSVRGDEYRSPDGGVHALPYNANNPNDPTNGISVDGSDVRATWQTSLGGTQGLDGFVVEFPDGRVGWFTHPMPLATAKSGQCDPVNHVLTQCTWDMLNIDGPEYGLTYLFDSFGKTLLTADYGDGSATPGWGISHIYLRGLNSQATLITFTWTTVNLTDPTNGNPTWWVLDAITMPAVAGGTVTVDFSSTILQPIARNTYDHSAIPDPNEPQCYSAAPTADVPFLNNIGISGTGTSVVNYVLTYQFPTAPELVNFQGLLQTLQLPTHGTINYTWAATTGDGICPGKLMGSPYGGTCQDPETGFPAGGGIQAPIQNGPITPGSGRISKFTDSSPAVLTRSAGAMLTKYNRYTFVPQNPNLDGSHDEDYNYAAMTRRVLVTRSSDATTSLTTRYIFHLQDVDAPDPQRSDLPAVDGGTELERIYYPPGTVDSNSVPVRTVVNCISGGASDTTLDCGVRNPTASQIDPLEGMNAFSYNSHIRTRRSVTWFGTRPGSNVSTYGEDCSLGTAPCETNDSTGYDSGVFKYDTSTLSAQRMPNTASQVTRIATTHSVAPGCGKWLLNLFDSKSTSDSGSSVAYPSSVSTSYSFNLCNGFLNSTATSDSSYGTLTTAYFDPNSDGAPDSIQRSGSGTGLAATVFTDSYTFQNGLALTKARTGVSFKSFEAIRDAATGLISTSKDPNGLATGYQYDDFGRITTVTPPGGEASTFVCYDSPTQTSVYRSTGVRSCPTGIPSGALTWQRYTYDQLGRLSNEIRQLPSATGFSVRQHAYDALGHEYFVSEWNPCSSVSACTTFSVSQLPICPSPGTAAKGTVSCMFDPFDRPQKVTKADGTFSIVDHTFIGTLPSNPCSAIPPYAGGTAVYTDFVDNASACNGDGSVAAGPTTTQKDDLGRAISVVEPAVVGGPADTTSYTNNALDKLAHVTQGVQNRSFVYDAVGFLRSETNPEKGISAGPIGACTADDFHRTLYSSYDALGNVLSKSDGIATATCPVVYTQSYTFSYDPLGRLWTEYGGGKEYLANCYDGTVKDSTHSGCPEGQANSAGGLSPLGRLTSRYANNFDPNANPVGTLSSINDDLTYSGLGGRLSNRATSIFGTPMGDFKLVTTPTLIDTRVKSSWIYNSLGLVQQYDHPSLNGQAIAQVTMYSSGLPIKVTRTVSGGATLDVAKGVVYNPAGGLASWTAGNASSEVITQDANLLARPSHITGGGYDSGTYAYDGAGNIKQIGLDLYGYDVRSRLTSWSGPSGSGNYNYDRFGNFYNTGFTIDTSTNRFLTYTSLNVTQNVTYDPFGLGGVASVPSGYESFTYDSLARQIGYQSGTYKEQFLFDGGNERVVRMTSQDVGGPALPQHLNPDRAAGAAARSTSTSSSKRGQSARTGSAKTRGVLSAAELRFGVANPSAHRSASVGRSPSTPTVSRSVSAQVLPVGGGAQKQVIPFLPSSYNASFVSQTVPSTMVAGTSNSVTIKMKNSGTVTWTGTSFLLRSLSSNWTPSFVNVSGSVAPGSTKTFTFNVTAPSLVGSYSFQWQMYYGGQSFGAATTLLTIPVTACCGDPTPPTTSITNPANGATVSGTVSVTATASDNVGVTTLEIYINGALKASNTNSTSLSYSWVTTTGYPDATYPIVSKAYDRGGNVTTSTTVQAHVNNTGPDTTPPTTTVTAPTNGSIVSGDATRNSMAATATDNDRVTQVEFYLDGVLFCTDPSSSYSCGWDTTAYPDGPHSIFTKAYDPANNVGTSPTVNVTIDNTPDTQPPTTSITAPAAGATVSGTVSVTANASDDKGVTKVELYVDGVLQSTDATSPYAFSWNTTSLTNDFHTLTTKAYDSVNVGTSSPISVHVNNTGDTTPPITSITSPTGGTVSGTIAVTATASDNVGGTGVTSVDFYLDGTTLLGSTSTGGPNAYTINWPTGSASDGPHSLASKAHDGGGNVTTSSPVSITVSNGGTSFPFWYLSFRDENDRLASQYTVTSTSITPTMDYFYLGDTLVSTRDGNGNDSYQFSDHLGSVREVMRPFAENDFYSYDPWGRPLQQDVSIIPVKYCGMERDYDTGKDYDHARFRSTYMGRFLGVDKTGGQPLDPQTWNRYGYARDNPMTYLDKDGNAFSLAVSFGLAYHDPRLNTGVNYLSAMSTVGGNRAVQIGIGGYGVAAMGPAAFEIGGAPGLISIGGASGIGGASNPDNIAEGMVVAGTASLALSPVEGGFFKGLVSGYLESAFSQKVVSGAVDQGKALMSAAFNATASLVSTGQAMGQTASAVVKVVYSGLAEAFSAAVTPEKKSNPDTVRSCNTQLFGCSSATAASQP